MSDPAAEDLGNSTLPAEEAPEYDPVWGDLETDEALLSGAPEDQPPGEEELSLLEKIAGSSDDADEGDGGSANEESAPAGKSTEVDTDRSGEEETRSATRTHENIVPSARVAKVIEQIREFSERAGVETPDFGDAVDMPASDFSELTTVRDRMKIRAAAAAVDLFDAPSPQVTKNQQQEGATDESADTFDLDANRQALVDAILEGNTAEAVRLERERDEYRDRQYDRRLVREREAIENRMTESASQAAAQQAFQAQLSRLVKDHPAIASNKFDNPIANDLSDWADLYVSRGASPAEALEKAAEKVLPLHQTKQPEPKAATPPAPKQDTRKAEAIKRNAAAAQAQAPQLDVGVGARTVPHAPDVSAIDQDVWDRLPKSERDRLLM